MKFYLSTERVLTTWWNVTSTNSKLIHPSAVGGIYCKLISLKTFFWDERLVSIFTPAIYCGTHGFSSLLLLFSIELDLVSLTDPLG